MKIFKFLILSVVILCITGCKSQLESTKELTAFKIQQALNEGKIDSDIVGVVSANSVEISTSSFNDLKSLVVTFAHNGQAVYVDGIEQVSGVTANDFTKSVKYVVRAQDGSELTYSVILKPTDSNALSSFKFESIKNSQLIVTEELKVSNSNITADIVAEDKNLTANFSSPAVKVTVNGVEQVSGLTKNDFSKPVTYKFLMRNGEVHTYVVSINWLVSNIPHIYIDTENSAVVNSKDIYLKANIRIDGKGVYTDYNSTTQIKGRGNSTWTYPKKPYRLKLDKKAALLGMATEKDWVLLANFLEPTQLLNTVALKIGRELNMPFTHHTVAVDLTMNGKYMGSYVMTEQVEISETRVNIDPETAVLLELDVYYDEEWKFKSEPFDLPVMVKDPDVTGQAHLDLIKKDFNLFAAEMNKTMEGGNYVDYIDIESVVKYFIVMNLTANNEINHPKSVYMHKEANKKYVMGPLWDFDWAYGFNGADRHFTTYTELPFSWTGVGATFFKRFMMDSRFRALYKKVWTEFRAKDYANLIKFIDQEAALVKVSVGQNSKLWPRTVNFDENISQLKTWLNNRARFIDTQVAGY